LFEEYLTGYVKQVTVQTYLKRLKRLSAIGNLDEPERIKSLICTYQSSECYKELLSDAYDYYVKFKGLTWIKPRFTREDIPIFLPTESELDQLIGRARLKMSVFLELLKETGADSGEAWKLRWLDIDVSANTVNISPTKNHNARTLHVSSHLVSRLNLLPKVGSKVFDKDLDDMRKCFSKMRERLSVKLENPRLKQIAFRSFRHWKATMEYHRTKDILFVKYILGHKRIENTLVYTHLVNFESDEYTCRIAKNVQEATALIESGYEYVIEMDGVKLFKKRK
jgi:integrase